MKIAIASVWLFAALAQCAPRMSFGDGGVALKELESRQFHTTPGAASVPDAYVSPLPGPSALARSRSLANGMLSLAREFADTTASGTGSGACTYTAC